MEMGTLMKVAVVDDSKEDAQLLTKYLNKFETEHDISISKTIFYVSFDFLEKYQGEYDVIFLDIEMPGSNGLEVAREIRSKDEAVFRICGYWLGMAVCGCKYVWNILYMECHWL